MMKLKWRTDEKENIKCHYARRNDCFSACDNSCIN